MDWVGIRLCSVNIWLKLWSHDYQRGLVPDAIFHNVPGVSECIGVLLTWNDISVIYVTAQMSRRTEEEVTVGFLRPHTFRRVLKRSRPSNDTGQPSLWLFRETEQMFLNQSSNYSPSIYPESDVPYSHEDAGGLSREYVLRIPSVS